MIPATVERVPLHTAEGVNAAIRRRSEESVARYASRGPGAVDRRLSQLDWEWDIERALEANAATVAMLGLTLGAAVNRKWFLLPAVVAGFLLQHAIQGWCPPVPLLRRLGFRTQGEIEYERDLLRSVRSEAPLPREFLF